MWINQPRIASLRKSGIHISEQGTQNHFARGIRGGVGTLRSKVGTEYLTSQEYLSDKPIR